MTLITVTHQEKRPNGSGHPFPFVKIGIVGIGWTGDGASITDIAKEQGDLNGMISFDLAPSPAGTWYVWNHSDGINQSTFNVPASGGPYTLQSRLVNAPVPAGQIAITPDMLAADLAGKANVPTGTPDGTKFYRDDGTWQVPTGTTMTVHAVVTS